MQKSIINNNNMMWGNPNYRRPPVNSRRETVDSHSVDGKIIQDNVGRRSSHEFDESLLSNTSHRDALDMSTAVLDACIRDLVRRRISMARIDSVVPAPPGNDSICTRFHQAGLTIASSTDRNGVGSTGNTLSLFGTHQQQMHQIQNQRMELDRRQLEIDMERQQLLGGLQYPLTRQAGMRCRMDGGIAGSQVGVEYFSGLDLNSSKNRIHSQGEVVTNYTSIRENVRDGGIGDTGNRQWWICQSCHSKAFSSRIEAQEHEALCSLGQSGKLQQEQEEQHDHFYQKSPRHATPKHRPIQSEHHQQRQEKNFKMGRDDHPMNQHNFPSMGAIRDMTRHQEPQPDGVHDTTGDDDEDEGPFAILPQPLPLSMPSDRDWLTPLHCFVRRHCVQVFSATNDDVATPPKGKRKPIQVGQIGIRCPHCHNSTSPSEVGQRERGSVYYPTTISSIYNATMNLLQRHLHSCSSVPVDIMDRYQTLKADDARSGTSKKYWVESALSLGLVDTPNGIRFSARRPPPLPRLSRQQTNTGMQQASRRNSNDFFSTNSNADGGGKESSFEEAFPDSDGQFEGAFGKVDAATAAALEKEAFSSAPLVNPEDKPYATAFSFHLLGQMQPCVFTEADRLGKRKGLPAGFAGLACRHCFGGYGSGRFFPSSIKTLSDTSKTLNVLYNHMMKCSKCPQNVKDQLEKLRVHHDDERAKMKFGSQKAFFERIWARLHEKDGRSGGVAKKVGFNQNALSPEKHNHEHKQKEGAVSNNGMKHNLSPCSMDRNEEIPSIGSKRTLPPSFMPPREMMRGCPIFPTRIGQLGSKTASQISSQMASMMGESDAMASIFGEFDILSKQNDAVLNKRRRMNS